jgi:hypothetical protein
MATYTPKALATQVALAAVNTAVYTPSGVTGIIRTIVAETTASGKSFTLSFGTDGVGTRLFDAYALTANTPSIFNGWWPVANAVAVNMYCAATAVNGGLYGYEFA